MSLFFPDRRTLLKTVLSVSPLVLAGPTFAAGSGTAPRQPTPVTARQVHSGHSLTDTGVAMGSGWPDQHYAKLLRTLAKGNPSVTLSTVPGSTMLYRKENEPSGAWRDMAKFEAVIVIERNDTYPVAVFGTGIDWIDDIRDERRRTMTDWFARAQQVGNRGKGSDFFFYTPWPAHGDYASPVVPYLAEPRNWRDRLSYDEVEYLDVASVAEANVPGSSRIWIIPGNAMMMRIYDDAEAGKVPGLRNGAAFMASKDWWSDDVHVQGLGSLALAYLHMYVIHHIDPRGKAFTGLDLTRQPNAEQAAYIQNMIYDLVQSYPRAGVT